MITIDNLPKCHLCSNALVIVDNYSDLLQYQCDCERNNFLTESLNLIFKRGRLIYCRFIVPVLEGHYFITNELDQKTTRIEYYASPYQFVTTSSWSVQSVDWDLSRDLEEQLKIVLVFS